MAKVQVHSTARAGGGLTAEVTSVLKGGGRMWLREVLLRVRDTASPGEVNSILRKLVLRQLVRTGKAADGRRRAVNWYQWAGRPEAA